MIIGGIALNKIKVLRDKQFYIDHMEDTRKLSELLNSGKISQREYRSRTLKNRENKRIISEISRLRKRKSKAVMIEVEPSEFDGINFIVIQDAAGNTIKVLSYDIIKWDNYLIVKDSYSKGYNPFRAYKLYTINKVLLRDGTLRDRKDSNYKREITEKFNRAKALNTKMKLFGNTDYYDIIDEKIMFMVTKANTGEFVRLGLRSDTIETGYPLSLQQVDEIIILAEIKNLPNSAFFGSRVKEISLSSSIIESLGVSSFASSAIVRFEVPGTVRSIGAGCFRNCKYLREVKFNGPLFYLGSCAFKSCESLEKIELPNGIGTLYENTFDDCKSLKSIRLPKSLRKFNPDSLCDSPYIVIECHKDNKEILEQHIRCGKYKFGNVMLQHIKVY